MLPASLALPAFNNHRYIFLFVFGCGCRKSLLMLSVSQARDRHILPCDKESFLSAARASGRPARLHPEHLHTAAPVFPANTHRMLFEVFRYYTWGGICNLKPWDIAEVCVRRLPCWGTRLGTCSAFKRSCSSPYQVPGTLLHNDFVSLSPIHALLAEHDTPRSVFTSFRCETFDS